MSRNSKARKAAKNPEGGVVIRASELMGHDIGRFVKFIERFGQERESVRVSKAPIDDVTGYKILDNHPE